jgi:OmpA-OmpF porin, OOP family
VNFGLAFIDGDVNPLLSRPDQNFGVGVNVRKSLGYIFSARVGYNFMLMTGRNWEFDNNLRFNKALNPSPNTSGLGTQPSYLDLNGPNYYDNPRLAPGNTSLGYDLNRTFIYNYRTWAHSTNVEFILNLGNLMFHRERNRWNIYGFAGFSATFTQTRYNALDKDGNVYDFSEEKDIWVNGNFSPYVNSTKSVRKSVQESLVKKLDNTYETYADNDNNVTGVKFWTLIPGFTTGVGVSFRPVKFMSISLEQRVILTSNDLIDGYRWAQDEIAAFTRDMDNISYTSINLGFHVGTKKQTEPLYWLNPMDYTYKKLGDVSPNKIAEDLFKDTDEDGVPDRLDKEPKTPKGNVVDVKGVTLDSDKDGIPDNKDKEPFSPPGYPIDQYGVAQVPPPACCDEIAMANKNVGVGKGGFDCTKMELPSVYFDDDKYYIEPLSEVTLHSIAERMQMCPDFKLVIYGRDQSKTDRKYNEQLAYNRTSVVSEYLIEKYGISRDRFIIKFEGAPKPKSATSLETKRARRVEFRYAAEGEGGDSNPPAPHPGLKAGSKE